jgi:hypothetical protein
LVQAVKLNYDDSVNVEIMALKQVLLSNRLMQGPKYTLKELSMFFILRDSYHLNPEINISNDLRCDLSECEHSIVLNERDLKH